MNILLIFLSNFRNDVVSKSLNLLMSLISSKCFPVKHILLWNLINIRTKAFAEQTDLKAQKCTTIRFLYQSFNTLLTSL